MYLPGMSDIVLKRVLTLLHSERPILYTILAILSEKGLNQKYPIHPSTITQVSAEPMKSPLNKRSCVLKLQT